MIAPIAARRLIRAPRERVFGAFVDARLLARWWGPKGFRNDFHEFAPVPGGVWRYTMRAPDGTAFLNKSVFVELARPKRVVIDLAEKDDATELSLRMEFEDPAEAERVRVIVTEANEQNLDRLEAVLKEND